MCPLQNSRFVIRRLACPWLAKLKQHMYTENERKPRLEAGNKDTRLWGRKELNGLGDSGTGNLGCSQPTIGSDSECTPKVSGWGWEPQDRWKSPEKPLCIPTACWTLSWILITWFWSKGLAGHSHEVPWGSRPARSFRTLSSVAKDTEVACRHSWEAGERKLWMETYGLSFMNMALWVPVTALSLTPDPSNSTRAWYGPYLRAWKKPGISISTSDTFILNFHELPSMLPIAGSTGLGPTIWELTVILVSRMCMWWDRGLG